MNQNRQTKLDILQFNQQAAQNNILKKKQEVILYYIILFYLFYIKFKRNLQDKMKKELT